MHKSPSLFFDILAEDDELKRNEKIQRASLDIKNHLAGSPGNGSTSPKAAAPAAATATSPAAARLWALQQRLLAPAAPGATGEPAAEHVQDTAGAAVASAESLHSAHDSQAATPQQPPSLQQQQTAHQQQQQQQQHTGQPQQVALVLSPQEVLQELLGDLFIHQDRLIMGELLGQGGFADVHRAELVDPLLGFTQQVAVKRLRPDVLKGPADLKEFLTEANLLRKLAHRHIVQLRGVGASDLTDLVAMRESMFVVQEFMAGGDLKAKVMAAMAQPFDPPYTKMHALTWALQIAEALHYLHCVCMPMIIHRDLKLDNILLTDTNLDNSVAKLADFGLHKRVRRMVASGTLVPWNQETTYHGIDYERSYYGGNMYLVKSAVSVASSVRDEGSLHGSIGGSMHGHFTAGQGLGLKSSSTAPTIVAGGASSAAPPQHGKGGGLGGVLAGVQSKNSNGGGGDGVQQDSTKPPLCPCHGSAPDGPHVPSLLEMGGSRYSVLPHSRLEGNGSVQAYAVSEVPAAYPQALGGPVPHSDSATSIQQASAAGAAGSAQLDDGPFAQQQQQQQLMSALRAKSQGLLGKQDFVTRVLSAARSDLLTGAGTAGLMRHDLEVSRTFAAVQALEGSVRAGNAYQQQPAVSACAPEAASHPSAGTQADRNSTRAQLCSTSSRPYTAGQPDSTAAAANQQQQQQQLKQPMRAKQQQPSELCPQLLEQLQDGLAAAQDSQKFIEGTQKVGSLLYMAPEVLAGHQYNEKIDVFSFGIILYELLAGVVIAGRVALKGEHGELLDYARQVANGHREALPTYWPTAVKQLIGSCWAQEPAKRPGFKEVLRQLYAMKQAGVDVQMEGQRPRGDYNPVADCGCCTIM